MARARKSNEEIVNSIVNYLKEQKGTVSAGQISEDLDIHSDTLDNWLQLGLLFQNACPKYEYSKAGRNRVIKILRKTKT